MDISRTHVACLYVINVLELIEAIQLIAVLLQICQAQAKSKLIETLLAIVKISLLQ